MEANLEKNPVKSPSIFGILTSPGEQFERIKTKPAIWGPLLLVLVLIVVGAVYTAVGTNYDAIFKESGLTGEELEIVRPLAVGGAIFGTIFIQIATVFIAPLIYWLCVKISGGTTTYRNMLSLNLFIMFISCIGLLINGLFLYFTDSTSLYNVTSLASIISAEQPLASILNIFEVFSLWGYVLLAVGLEKVGGISKKSAWISVAVLFGILLLFSVASGFFDAMSAGA